MANEITVTCKMSLANGNLKRSGANRSNINFTQTTKRAITDVQTIGSGAEEAINVTDLVATGWAWFQNLDASNDIDVGVQSGGTFYPLFTLEPGMPGGPIYLNGRTPYAKASAATADLEYEVYDQ